MALHLVRVDAVGLRAGDELVGVAVMWTLAVWLSAVAGVSWGLVERERYIRRLRLQTRPLERMLDLHCKHPLTMWCGTHGWSRCVSCGYCWGLCGRCGVVPSLKSESEEGS